MATEATGETTLAGGAVADTTVATKTPEGEVGKSPETLASEAAAKAEADKGKTPEQIASEKAAADKEAADKAAADKKAEDAKGNKAKDGAPEKYEDFKVPEGVVADEVQVNEFKGIAKELNLTQDQAQRLVDFQAKNLENFAKAQTEQWQGVMKDWRDKSRSDAEVGGAKFDQSIKNVGLALQTFGTPGLRQMLDATGTGNHVEMIRLLSKIGGLIGEDKIQLGNAAGGDRQKSRAELLFPNQKPTQ